MLKATLFIFMAVFCSALLITATPVQECNKNHHSQGVPVVNISKCSQTPCKLRRGTEISVEETFIPTRNVEKLTTAVSATVFGVKLPFVGVDGKEACSNVYDELGNKVGCPLKKGVTYKYRNSFPVLPLYPKLSVQVTWDLRSKDDSIVCFEVPAKITG